MLHESALRLLAQPVRSQQMMTFQRADVAPAAVVQMVEVVERKQVAAVVAQAY